MASPDVREPKWIYCWKRTGIGCSCLCGALSNKYYSKRQCGPRAHFPPRPRQTTWHTDITDGISPQHVPQTVTRCNHVTPSSIDTNTHPAHQRHATNTHSHIPNGTGPRNHTFHRGWAKPNGTVTPNTYFRHTVCHTLDAAQRKTLLALQVCQLSPRPPRSYSPYYICTNQLPVLRQQRCPHYIRALQNCQF